MTSGHDILCISSIDWDFIWQGHQEIMARLAAQGNRVLFVENTGVRPPRLSDVSRIRSRLRNWWRGTKGFREERPNLFVLSPVVLPFPYSRVAQRINGALLLRALRRWMLATGFHAPIVWTFLPTPLARDLIRGVDPRLTIYHCTDDLASSSRAARRIRRSEDQLFREADLVFVTSERLGERAAAFNRHVHLFPSGVNYEAFETVRQHADAVAPEIKALPRPVVGYVGGLHRWLDQPLVCALADAMPEGSVVLVGPEQTDVSALRARRNIHLIGARPHAELPGYIKGFDAGIVPYRLTDYTAHVFPSKLNEYLAMGVAVVTTDLPEMRRFRDKHGGLIASAEPQAFVAAVRDAIRPASPDDVERRVQVARDNSWSNQIAGMSALIDQALARRERAAERWDVVLRGLYRRARRRTVPAAAALLATYLVLFQTPAIWIAARPLLVSSPLEPADAIVVFGGGVGESGRASDSSYQERVKQAVDLYHAGLAPTVVFSSGFVYLFEEARLMKAMAAASGVPESDVILETRAGSTHDNVVFARDIADRRGWRRVLLVSSPYHMRRATLTWRKLAPGVEVIAVPTGESRFYEHDFGASPQQIRGIVHEYAAIVYYWAKGWI